MKTTALYQKTPVGIMEILDLFHTHALQYILFKCEHIFEGQNKNLDILFKTTEDYRRAAALLEQQGFVIRLSEQIERYKTMYCGLINKTIYSIHLHREIAWHGMVVLGKEPVFQRAELVHPSISIPSVEDSILIHAAHVLFENFKVKEREKNYFIKLDYASTDKDYIRWQIHKNHWEKGFWRVIKSGQLSKVEIGKLWIERVWKEPATAAYLFLKAMRIPLRKLSLQRGGCLIALIGANGSGKSTLSKKLVEHYSRITVHLGKSCHYYYYGWKPTFIITKIGSRILKAQGKKIFQEAIVTNKKISLKDELLIGYQFVEYLYRYLTEIHPKLRKNKVVVSDRYFYDIYGQYPYAEKSLIIKPLLKLFPKPDFTYFLDANEYQLQRRQKTNKEENSIQTMPRKVLPMQYLTQQRVNFKEITKWLPIVVLSTQGNIGNCCQQIIIQTWKKIL